VKAYNLSVNGDEKPVAFYSALETFPGSLVYGKVPSAIYYYEAFTSDVSVYVVNRDDYVSFVRSNPDILFDELQTYVADQLGMSMRLNALQHSRASDKLIYTLHYLALSHGREAGPQELNKLKHLGVINYSKNTPYELDIQRLNSILNDQYIADNQIQL
jgi:hypothetical protein